jgi:glyoxylase-like metal-dependent hydrolase (beta-lactamase superfamily II)
VRFIERGWLSANMILLGGDARGPLVVDTGYATHANQTLALVDHQLHAWNHQRPRALVNTHLHSDHCGGNAALQARYGSPAWIPPAEFDAVARWDQGALSYADTGQQCPRFTPHERLVPGQCIEHGGHRWDIHAAPGHDPASVVLHEPRLGLLISADTLWERGFGIAFPEVAPRPALGEAFLEVEQTLDLIEALAPQRVLPGHGPQFSDVPKALAEARGRLAYFRAEPIRHALHAAKALLVYHLLEFRQQDWPTLQQWMTTTPVQGRLMAAAGEADPIRWTRSLVDSLARAGQLTAGAEGVRCAT